MNLIVCNLAPLAYTLTEVETHTVHPSLSSSKSDKAVLFSSCFFSFWRCQRKLKFVLLPSKNFESAASSLSSPTYPQNVFLIWISSLPSGKSYATEHVYNLSQYLNRLFAWANPRQRHRRPHARHSKTELKGQLPSVCERALEGRSVWAQHQQPWGRVALTRML